jgi:hypothetical protein
MKQFSIIEKWDTGITRSLFSISHDKANTHKRITGPLLFIREGY